MRTAFVGLVQKLALFGITPKPVDAGIGEAGEKYKNEKCGHGDLDAGCFVD
jgi:hypothetical protein